MSTITTLRPRPGHATGCVAPDPHTVESEMRKRMLRAYGAGRLAYQAGRPFLDIEAGLGSEAEQAGWRDGWLHEAHVCQKTLRRAAYIFDRRSDIIDVLDDAIDTLRAVRGSGANAVTAMRCELTLKRAQGIRVAISAGCAVPERPGRGAAGTDDLSERSIGLIEEDGA